MPGWWLEYLYPKAKSGMVKIVITMKVDQTRAVVNYIEVRCLSLRILMLHKPKGQAQPVLSVPELQSSSDFQPYDRTAP
jgi:hypothetical protein